MTASLPLQNFRPVLRLVAGRTFANYLEDLGFGHSGLKLRKPFVHLTGNKQEDTECDYKSFHVVDFISPHPNRLDLPFVRLQRSVSSLSHQEAIAAVKNERSREVCDAIN